jgi:hypothetical protein
VSLAFAVANFVALVKNHIVPLALTEVVDHVANEISIQEAARFPALEVYSDKIIMFNFYYTN